MDNLTEMTINKIRQVTFKIIEQAGLIDSVKDKNIQPQILENKVIEAIRLDNANWLKIFFVSDMDIAQMTKQDG